MSAASLSLGQACEENQNSGTLNEREKKTEELAKKHAAFGSMSVDVGNMATGSTDKSIKLWRLLVGALAVLGSGR